MDPSAKESTPKQEKSSDAFLSMFDSLMSIPSGLAKTCIEVGIGAVGFVKGLAKGMANVILPTDSSPQPAKA